MYTYKLWQEYIHVVICNKSHRISAIYLARAFVRYGSWNPIPPITAKVKKVRNVVIRFQSSLIPRHYFTIYLIVMPATALGMPALTCPPMTLECALHTDYHAILANVNAYSMRKCEQNVLFKNCSVWYFFQASFTQATQTYEQERVKWYADYHMLQQNTGRIKNSTWPPCKHLWRSSQNKMASL